MWQVVRVPEAFACAVSDSVSGPVSAPSCPGVGSRPWTSSFTVYTNNSIYKGITPAERRMREVLQEAWLWPTCAIYPPGTREYYFLKLPGSLLPSKGVGGGASSGIKKTQSALFPGTPGKRWQRVCFSPPLLRQCLKPKPASQPRVWPGKQECHGALLHARLTSVQR